MQLLFLHHLRNTAAKRTLYSLCELLQIHVNKTIVFYLIHTCMSGCQLETGGSGRQGAPSRRSGSLQEISNPGWHKFFKMISAVWRALVIFDTINVVNVMPEFFSRFPVSSACCSPNSLSFLSASFAPLRLYWPCRIKIICRITFAFFFSSCSVIFPSSSVPGTSIAESRLFRFGGFNKLYGSRLQKTKCTQHINKSMIFFIF